MFKKALAHHSNATPIRSSARRALVASIFAQYPALNESVASEGEDAPDKLSEKDLGRALVPDGVRSSNFETSAGIEGTMYLSPDGDPLWLSIGRGSTELVPTLELLARLPPNVHPFPVLQLPIPLPPPLLAGAALFLPAVRHLHTPWRLPQLPAGSIVAFAAGGSGDVSYVGVGRVVAADGLEGALTRLVKHRTEGVDCDEGKFADIICIVDDRLWDMGSKSTLVQFALPSPREPFARPPQAESAHADAAAEGVAAVSLDDSEEPTIESSEPLTPAEVSTLLSAALLQTLATLPVGTLPLPASQLYSSHILPNRPAYIPAARRDDVVIGRSEWKKLAKWMKEVAKDGVIKTKETKGEVVVTSYDPKHPAIDGHAAYKTISEDEAKAARRAAREEEAAAPPKTLDIQELWRPAGSSAAFWAACGVEKGSLNQPSSIKPLFDAYVEKNGLEDKEHRRLVALDKPLASAVGAKEGQALVRDEALRRLRAGLGWVVSIAGNVKKGALNPITIQVKTRQGRKQVTLVAGLEGFAIDPDDFAEDLRRRCAGSTSVQPLTGASPKLNLKEVMVQGAQGKAVTEALVERGVPRRWIKDEGKKK
ncbi:uncharacterized protein CcaverHIS019_0510010 [Cutaneotrichosporon cavernicola]|uniref:SUI1 domain-containing protein n=1 Tax=Cutaneotrichosporon cavernicola TaxID=279322 RepID=A0AA48L7M3_9TREE|nr:uncharacterized protein CcaverHIS019_0510010 [Cutaneotrichosporon cavernicola]BEI93373.1 hypothetical protein CcaverHIS019_0510010 [Cutaneotrichosporon cavernicola]BEJ01151.1 hypothetical protein CcaverHIS631_0510080 [Cutaneotrichosporon cavernicola]BEJ08919.1 hypothetical protein CcaverHIS641_0510130 [Cutaneotrichosporon cavernicola]